jgi:hypothetical protein
MLTLVEDTIARRGDIRPDTTGVYGRLVTGLGLGHAALHRYAGEIWRLCEAQPPNYIYPEWVLQHLDDLWMSEVPTQRDRAIYRANGRYVQHWLDSLGDRTGVALETLVQYIMSCIPGCRTIRRKRSHSTDYDVVCSVEGVEVDFLAEIGRCFVCECKDWAKAADFSTMAKFCRVLDSIKVRFGVIASPHGISGPAERERLKVFQDRGIVVIVLDREVFDLISKGANLVPILRSKYDQVRLDLP